MRGRSLVTLVLLGVFAAVCVGGLGYLAVGMGLQVPGIDRGTVSGIAPRARIVAYKALGEQGGTSADLAQAIDLAVGDGVDVINYSIGSSSFLQAVASSTRNNQLLISPPGGLICPKRPA